MLVDFAIDDNTFAFCRVFKILLRGFRSDLGTVNNCGDLLGTVDNCGDLLGFSGFSKWCFQDLLQLVCWFIFFVYMFSCFVFGCFKVLHGPCASVLSSLMV